MGGTEPPTAAGPAGRAHEKKTPLTLQRLSQNQLQARGRVSRYSSSFNSASQVTEPSRAEIQGGSGQGPTLLVAPWEGALPVYSTATSGHRLFQGIDASGDGRRPQTSYPTSKFKNSFKEVLPSVEAEVGTGVGVFTDLMSKKGSFIINIPCSQRG